MKLPSSELPAQVMTILQLYTQAVWKSKNPVDKCNCTNVYQLEILHKVT